MLTVVGVMSCLDAPLAQSIHVHLVRGGEILTVGARDRRFGLALVAHVNTEHVDAARDARLALVIVDAHLVLHFHIVGEHAVSVQFNLAHLCAAEGVLV